MADVERGARAIAEILIGMGDGRDIKVGEQAAEHMLEAQHLGLTLAFWSDMEPLTAAAHAKMRAGRRAAIRR